MTHLKGTIVAVVIVASFTTAGVVFYTARQPQAPQPSHPAGPASTSQPQSPDASGSYQVVFRQEQPASDTTDQQGSESVNIASDQVFALISPADDAMAKAQQLADTIHKQECHTARCAVLLFDDAKASAYEQDLLGLTKDKVASMSPEDLARIKVEFQSVKLPFIGEHHVATYQPGMAEGYTFQYYPERSQGHDATSSQSLGQTSASDAVHAVQTK